MQDLYRAGRCYVNALHFIITNSGGNTRTKAIKTIYLLVCGIQIRHKHACSHLTNMQN